MNEDIAQARKLLEADGYVVLREKSYRQAQERQRVAEALRAAAEEQVRSTQRWVEDRVLPRERHLSDRLTFVYGQARAAGLTVDDLAGGSCACGSVGCSPSERSSTG